MQDDIGNMEKMWANSHISGGNLAYVDSLYEEYLNSPQKIEKKWRKYFDQLSNKHTSDFSHASVIKDFIQLGKSSHQTESASIISAKHEQKQIEVLRLISAYRIRGHQKANIDPLGTMEREQFTDLTLKYHSLTENDLSTQFQTNNLFIGKQSATLSEIISKLASAYCGSLGVEFMHISNTKERHWIQQHLERDGSTPKISTEKKLHILDRLTASEILEKYLGTKYPGTKRFGLEGGESLIPMIDEMIQKSSSYGTKEIVIGMAHRGRLNVLVNIFGKKPSDLFNEFEGKNIKTSESGDVKYHQGFSSNLKTGHGEVHLALAFNPSHLEIVAPVIEGSVRARQDRRSDYERNNVIPIVIHGDAAFAGQGVVMETLQMSQTRAYKTGGSVHIIINNQVGFTTSRRDDARSTEYCTDVAKMLCAPIFHVNGDDPETVVNAAKLAIEYRMKFKKDIVIDMICYRRKGHNEADEPSTTQPFMYQVIKKHATTRTLYAQKLKRENILTDDTENNMIEQYRTILDKGENMLKSLTKSPDTRSFIDWKPYLNQKWTEDFKTSVTLKNLKKIGQKICQLPNDFVLQKQVSKLVEDRRKMATGKLAINWGFAEIMAYATLIDQGFPIRLTGQDVGRGTFSHRHAVHHDQENNQAYTPLSNLSDKATFQIWDSFLSEEAVLAFEYGYATTLPNTMVIWEAQFGDFANGCQVVIDQFITSGEHKWGRLCGLVMLLPHGYEGQGPEHSSARLERYLQLCAQQNIQVCVPTTPAQVFHMLRRQMVRLLRKPLIVFTPKSLLRHKLATSSLEDLSNGEFHKILPEIDEHKPTSIQRVIMCSGKVYYDLLEKKRNEAIKNVAIIRIEQLYPFPLDNLVQTLSLYPNLKKIIWCQEEPKNQGAWYCSMQNMKNAINQINSDIHLLYSGRSHSAAPACGYMSQHIEEQQTLINEAFTV